MTNTILVKIFPYISLLFIIRLWKLFYDLRKNNIITNYNLVIYNKVILKKIIGKEKTEKEYKDKVITTLDKISKNKQ